MDTHREISDTATGGMPSMFPVVTVADAAAWLTEPLGSKQKFWFRSHLSYISLKRLGWVAEPPVRIGLKK
jgi:hypothetical protein